MSSVAPERAVSLQPGEISMRCRDLDARVVVRLLDLTVPIGGPPGTIACWTRGTASQIGLSPAFLRPNKANKAKLSSVSECLHSEVSLVRGGKTRLTRLNSGVGILEQLVGGWVTRLNYCGRHAGKI